MSDSCLLTPDVGLVVDRDVQLIPLRAVGGNRNKEVFLSENVQVEGDAEVGIFQELCVLYLGS